MLFNIPTFKFLSKLSFRWLFDFRTKMTDSTSDSMSKLPEQVDIASENGNHVQTIPSYEPDELPRQFSLLSTLAFGFSMTNSWLGYSATFITPLLLGGSPTVFFGLIAASIASCFISKSYFQYLSRGLSDMPLFLAAGLAELASAYPSSGGQYHFAYMVTPPKYRALVAFVMGWLSVVAWALTSASTALVCGESSFQETGRNKRIIYL